MPELHLPRLMLVTSRARMRPSFESALECALQGGVRLVQLREKDLQGDELFRLAALAEPLCQRFGAHLLLNAQAGAAPGPRGGVHWPASALTGRKELPRPFKGELAGCSVHSVEEAGLAERAGANYLVFGSVFATASHPGEEPAGLAALRRVARNTALPVFAIGGINVSRVEDCLEAGAHGVAVIGAVWDAPSPAMAARELLLALSGGA